MKEKIGKVTLNLDYYSGEDLYSDGDIEDHLLDIVKKHSPKEFTQIIREEASWPILYHLSEERQNIVNWYPFDFDGTLLEIGAGCGAITSSLVNQVRYVTALDLSKKRSMINAYRNQEAENLEILVGNFNDIANDLHDKYQYVTLIGVLEYAQCYIAANDSINIFLKKIHGLIEKKGKLLIAIENQLGLKYFAGCKEDHTGEFFDGVEGYPRLNGIRTFSKLKLKDYLENNGFCNVEFYYPYPDYKFPTTIYSDRYLPTKGELNKNIRNFDMDRLVLFDENKAFDTIIEAGLFGEFSNSFFVTAERED